MLVRMPVAKSQAVRQVTVSAFRPVKSSASFFADAKVRRGQSACTSRAQASRAALPHSFLKHSLPLRSRTTGR
jgi:hypothetical protein